MAFQNFFATRLFTDAGSSDTILTLELAPTVTSGHLTLEARNPTKREIISYTGVSGNDITGVTRGVGGTSATTHIKGSLVEMNVTAEDLNAALGLAFAFPTGIVMPYAGSITPSGWLAADGAAVSRTAYAALFTALGTTYGAGNGSTTFNVPDMRSRLPMGAGQSTYVDTQVAANYNTSDIITVTFNDTLQTGKAVVLTTDGTAPTGLTAGNTYYVIRLSSTTISLASSLANAVAGTAIDITATGSGNHTLTLTFTNRSLGAKGGEEAHSLTIGEQPAHAHNLQTRGDGSGSFTLANNNTGGGAGSVTGGIVNSTGGSGSHNILNPYLALNYIIKT